MDKETSAGVRSGKEKTTGIVRIADEVVAHIASLAALEVPGVAGMSNNDIFDMVGWKPEAKGVRVGAQQRHLKIDLALMLSYGCNIPETCRMVQENVKDAIERMTGLEVTDVNIRIAGISAVREEAAE